MEKAKKSPKNAAGRGKVTKGEVFDLAKLVEYSEDSVVSRTIIQKETGTVTIFAFDEGQGLSEHAAPFDAMVYVADGEAVITISKKPHRLKKGEFIIMPADKPHAVDAVKKFKMVLIMIRTPKEA